MQVAERSTGGGGEDGHGMTRAEGGRERRISLSRLRRRVVVPRCEWRWRIGIDLVGSDEGRTVLVHILKERDEKRAQAGACFLRNR